MGVAFGRGWGSGKGKAGEFDSFFLATGITDEVQKSAVISLANGLKHYNLWDKLAAIYPFVGGKSNSHKWNLKDVFKHSIAWGEAEEHSVGGVVLGNSVAFIDLSFSEISSNPTTSFHCSMYVRNEVSSTGPDWASANIFSGVSTWVGANTKFTDGSTSYVHGDVQTRINTPISASTRLMSWNKLGNTQSVYREGALVSSKTSTSSVDGHLGITLNPVSDSNRQIAFVCFGEGLTAAEISNLNLVINSFQSSLGRAV